MIGKTISHYQILEKLGEGGMGVVYKAEDTKLQRTVALKFLPLDVASDNELRQRFINEARTASALNHPNICTIYSVEDGEQPFIAMEFVEGKELRDLVQHAVPLQDVINYATQIAEGLQAAHKKGIVHRDIKPANIMVTDDGLIKVMDFGLAKMKGQPALTKTGSTLGTVAYMSPEQARNEEVDQRSDIFSFGAVLYELCSGRQPFAGDYEAATLYSVVHEQPEALPDAVPPELQNVVFKCLEKEVNNRYQSAAELLVDLHQFQRKQVSHEFTDGASRRPRAAKKRMLWPVTFIGVVILAVTGYFLFVSSQKEAAPERKMLVVLPFENLGPPADEYFADGITEEITSRLAGLHGLGVISRTSAIQYKNMEKTIAAIGEELGVGYVLTGTIRWNRGRSNSVRVTTQLIRVSDDTHLWTRTYEKVLDEIFAVQSGIAEEVAKQLDLNLLEPERKALLEKPTDNLQAYDFYLRGKQYATQLQSGQQQKRAVEMYEKAIELDSTFALAYANLSDTQSLMYFWSFDETAERLSKSKAAADKALALQPDLPEAHVALAYYYYRGRRDFDRALQVLEVVRRTRPNFANIIIGRIQRRQGKWQESLTSLDEAFKLDPRSAESAVDLAYNYTFLRNYKKAEAWLQEALSLSPDYALAKFLRRQIVLSWTGDIDEAWSIIESYPEWPEKHFWTIQMYILEKRYDQALQKIASISAVAWEDQALYEQKHLSFATTYWLQNKQLLSRTYADTLRMILKHDISKRRGVARLHSALGLAYAFLGRTEEAIKEGRRALELMPVSKDALAGPVHVQRLARIYAILGEYDPAIEKLEYLLSIPSPLSVTWLKIDPTWDGLRSHPRFQKLLEKYSGSGS